MVDSESSVAKLLGQVTTNDDLHAVLARLAEDGTSRWSRTHVMYYLPDRWRSRARDYFDGERLRMRSNMPKPRAVATARALSQSVADAARRLGEDVQMGESVSLPHEKLLVVEELLALPEPPGNEPLSNMLRALREEIRRVHHERPRRFRLKNGRCIGSITGQFRYRFAWSSEPDPFAPGQLRIGRARAAARVGEPDPHGDGVCELIVEEYVGAEVPAAEFAVDSTFLLRVVHEKLRQHDESSEEPARVAALLCRLPELSHSMAQLHPEVLRGLNREQQRAVQVACSTQRSYVWGPPGTGKTTSVAALVQALTSAHKRVLVISPYNVAVDQAILAIAIRNGIRPVRVGRANDALRAKGLDLDSRLEEAAVDSGLLAIAQSLVASAMAKHAGEQIEIPPSVRECIDELGAWIAASRRRRADDDIRALSELLAKLRNQYRAPEGDIIAGAQVVGCTMALSFVSEAIHRRSYNHVLIDEASVVRSPEAVLSALSAMGAPVTFFGDPKQLPPIVVEQTPNTERWLRRNPFALAEIEQPTSATGGCVMLREQHRMAPPIRSLVSDLFYDSKLEDGAKAPPLGKVVVVDSSATGARSTPKMINLSNSKENVTHRHLVAEMVRFIRQRAVRESILVLSPFKAQKRAYKAERSTADLGDDIRYETIHSSQGTEQDVVIIDFVLAGSGPGTRSRMLDSRQNPSLSNLLNVGMSRARNELFLLVDLELVGRAPAGDLWRLLIEMACARGQLIRAPGDLQLRRYLQAHFDKAG